MLEGRWPLRTLPRLSETTAQEAAPADGDEVAWRVQGVSVPVAGGPPESWLHLDASAVIALTCQRCLGPVRVPLEVHRRILFVAGEDAAARLDAEREEDVLALSRALDLRELVEDELLLAAPLVPMHDACPEPLRFTDDDRIDDGEEHPFAALAALRRPPRPI